ncbi:MAG: LysM peptidoglycan-binding domain-containing protein, partial [Deltaproteobacteria bacterium]|nr:LysM peptidoglycan-binding domain-containing protein [Deltaproteobacteria bacterium]
MNKNCLLILLPLLLAGCPSSPPSWWSFFGDDRPSSLSREGADGESADPAPVIPGEEGMGIAAGEELLATEEAGGGSQGAETAPESLSHPCRPRIHFTLPVADHPKIDQFVAYYSGPNQYGFGQRLERSGRYVPLMREIFAEEGLPEDLVYLALVESGFLNRAYSWAQAAGPWQFIETTGRLYDLENDWWRDERRDPVKSSRAAARHLKRLYSRFGDWYLAVAAYNAGSGTVLKGVRGAESKDFWEISRGSHLRDETKDYVPKFLAALKIAQDPHQYGFGQVAYQPPLLFDTVTVPTSTDLEVAARLCGASYEEIKTLNPELKRWCTPPGVKDYRLRLPPGCAERFADGYAALPEAERARFQCHRIVQGDTLKGLAHRYRIRIDDIMTLNRIKDPRLLRIGQMLVLPLKEGYTRSPLEDLEDDYLRSRRQVYTVRPGDSLWLIARRNQVTEMELRVWNRLGWNNTIRPGQVLAVSQPSRNSRSKKVRMVAVKERRKIVYQVRSGDTLWEIGRRFKVATQDIRVWNNLSERDVLKPGASLTLHVEP